jgi:hypothetical protein
MVHPADGTRDYLWGGGTNESKFFDGQLVNNFSLLVYRHCHKEGLIHFFFKGTLFSAGGYFQLYGQSAIKCFKPGKCRSSEKTETSLGFSVLEESSAGIQTRKIKKAKLGHYLLTIRLSLAFACHNKKKKNKSSFFSNASFPSLMVILE